MNNKIPTVLIIFGATGDLMAKKITPVLFDLFCKNKLSTKFYLMGFSRRDLTQTGFKKHIQNILDNHQEIKRTKRDLENFLKLVSFERGDFDKTQGYFQLAKKLGRIDNEWQACSNKLFYLAVPPSHYKSIFKHLVTSGLSIPCGSKEGWTKIIVEKPFGKDLKTSEELDILLAKAFKEEQIYRIDHYLAKEMLQNILSFRFANNFLEQSWNNKYIERINIRLWEKLGVESRGNFYNGLGALRDIGQNHLLQMLALVTMERPQNMKTNAVRLKRTQLLETLNIPKIKEIVANTYRSQYTGFKKIEGVEPLSSIETYFKIKGYLNSPRWQGVPIWLEGGKRLKKQIKEIEIVFKQSQNKIIFSLEPEEKIEIYFLAKKPGLTAEVEERTLNFLYRSPKIRQQYIEEYEKLLLDCFEGNQLLFVTTREIKAMWRFIDPIICAWDENKVPLNYYKPDTLEPIKQAIKMENNHQAIKHKEFGIIGLGKMGANLARQAIKNGWKVMAFNRTAKVTRAMGKEGLIGTYSLKELTLKLKPPRVIWVMLPAGKPTEEIIFGNQGLINLLDKGDMVIEAGNSYYQDSIRRAKLLAAKEIKFIDAGVSGGPAGALNGACLMIGGDRQTFEYLLPLFLSLAVPNGVQFFNGIGAGHFVKMIHNGIEYGMMQAIAEGFTVLEKADYKLNLKDVAEIYNHGSVVESRLMGWLKAGLEIYGNNLTIVEGSVAHTGEGEWTVKAAKEMGVKAKVIEEALKFRKLSQKKPDFTGKILTVLRNMFGGHAIKIE